MTDANATVPAVAKIWIHGAPAKSWAQVILYLNGDAHDRSKVQVLVAGELHDLVLGRSEHR